ncbi:MAG: LysR family transcriptional regulator [Gammaproteobacteria bacterium]|nr:LysR family transcriptional regulator [Gammaproteobacteria bacterium]
MTPRQLQAFAAVAQTLSFARACERLHMSQPALSLAIKNLEEELGGRLFARTTRQVRLTPEGAALLPQALQLLADWENVRERLRQRFTLQRGHVTIAAMPSFAQNILPRILKEYREHHPNVEVTVHDVIQEQVVEMVETGRVEVGFGFEPDTDTLAFERLFVDRFVAVVPADSALASRKTVSWAELLEHDFITLQRPSSMRRLLEDSLAAKGMKLRVALECHQLATISQWVAAGLGVSVMPALCERHVSAAGARCVRLSRPAVQKAVGLMTRRGHELSTAAFAVKAAMREAFKSTSKPTPRIDS